MPLLSVFSGWLKGPWGISIQGTGQTRRPQVRSAVAALRPGRRTGRWPSRPSASGDCLFPRRPFASCWILAVRCLVCGGALAAVAVVLRMSRVYGLVLPAPSIGINAFAFSPALPVIADGYSPTEVAGNPAPWL